MSSLSKSDAGAHSAAPKRPRQSSPASNLPRRTRIKISPPAESSSASPVSSGSDHPALVPTSASTASAAATDPSDIDPDEESSVLSDSSSAVSSSSDEEDSENDSEEEEEEDDDSDSEDDGSSGEQEENEDAEGRINLTVGRGKKPNLKAITKLLARSDDLYKRMDEFLPKLKAANEELEREREAGALKNRVIEKNSDGEEDEDGGQYIEMNLGLGVLEHKDPNAENSETESEDDDENGGGWKDKEKDILGRLMGQDKDKKARPGIQVISDT